MNNYDTFIFAIHNTLIIKLTFNANEKGTITRDCIPYDFGPSKRYHNNQDRYHFYDLDSPDGKHNLSIFPNQVISISLTEKTFNPGDYVTWDPDWTIPRDWGIYS